MEYEKIIMRREAKKIFDLVLEKNRKFHCKFALLSGIFSDDRLKEHTGIVNRKSEENYFVIN